MQQRAERPTARQERIGGTSGQRENSGKKRESPNLEEGNGPYKDEGRM